MNRSALLILLLLTVPLEVRAQAFGWTRYSDPETHAAIDLPAGVFTVDAGRTSGSQGRSFRTEDGRADLSVYSVANAGRSPSEFLRTYFQLPASSIVYQRITGRMLTVSGYKGDKIWYARCNFGSSRVVCMAMNYPTVEKRQWDGIVTRISHSLAHGSG